MNGDGANNTSERFLTDAKKALREENHEKALRAVVEGLKHDPSVENAVQFNRIAGKVHLSQGALSHARAYSEKSLKLAREKGEYQGICQGLILLGNVLARMDQYGEAEKLWQEANQLSNKNHDKSRKGKILINLAALQQRRGDHLGALDTLKDAEKCLAETDDHRSLTVCYGRMISAYAEIGEANLAFQMVNKLEGMAQKAQSKKIMAIAQSRKGMLYLSQDYFKEASDFLKQAVMLYREIQDKKNLALTLCNLSAAYINTQDIEEINNLLSEAMSLAEGVNSKSVMNAVKLVLAQLAAFRNDYPMMLEHYQDALREAKSINNDDRFIALYKSLKEVIEKKGVKIKGLDKLLSNVQKAFSDRGFSQEATEIKSLIKQIPAR